MKQNKHVGVGDIHLQNGLEKEHIYVSHKMIMDALDGVTRTSVCVRTKLQLELSMKDSFVVRF